MKRIVLLSILVLILTACNNEEVKDNLLASGKIDCNDIETIKSYADYLIIDVRTPEEYNEGHLDNAINIEYQDIVLKLEEKNISKSMPIIVYCKSGGRSKQAFESLEGNGFTHVYDLGAMSNCN